MRYCLLFSGVPAALQATKNRGLFCKAPGRKQTDLLLKRDGFIPCAAFLRAQRQSPVPGQCNTPGSRTFVHIESSAAAEHQNTYAWQNAPFFFGINQQGRLVVDSMAAVYHTQTGVSTPFFAGFTKSRGFPLARCTSGAAQKAAPRRRERRAGCCCYSLKRALAVMPSSSGRSGWSAGRSPFGASWSAGSFSAASASSGLRWRAY